MQTIYPWQQVQWQQLNNRKNNLPHALLLTGHSGLGKFIFAQTFAQAVLCEQPQPFACGQCHACHLLSAGSHPDLYTVQPEEAGKTIKVDQVRKLAQQLQKTATLGGYQIAIIKPAEAMNNAAANALLKTLEEPPGRVVILLISHHPALLRATIRSRCQHIKFFISEQHIAHDWLSQQLPESQTVDLLLRLTDYAPLAALTLAQSEQLTQRQQCLDAVIKLFSQQLDAVAVAECCHKFVLHDVLQWLLTFFLDVLRVQQQVNENKLINQDKLVAIKQLAVKISSSITVVHWLEKIMEVKRLPLQHINLNNQLLLESLFIEMGKGESVLLAEGC